MITLTPEQKKVVEFCVERIKRGEPLTTVGGYAGTGKTTIMGEIVKALRPARIAFACYTGKAKSVLEAKLRASVALEENDYIGTLHSLVFKPNRVEEESVDKKTGKPWFVVDCVFSSKEKRDDFDDDEYDVIIIDEASMVDSRIFHEVVSMNTPIIAVGDHGQLSPINSDMNLMGNPMVRLEKIHRQAEGNPIIHLSKVCRESGVIEEKEYGPNVKKIIGSANMNGIDNIESWQLISASNIKRCSMNRYMRARKFGDAPELPQPGEKVICLRNNRKLRVFNGMIGRIVGIQVNEEHWLDAQIDMGDFVYKGKIWRHQFLKSKACTETCREAIEVHPDHFGDLFDYAYCITCHKSQGSEFDKVIFFEEKGMKYVMEVKFKKPGEWKRLLYTAVTRAKKELLIIEE